MRETHKVLFKYRWAVETEIVDVPIIDRTLSMNLRDMQIASEIIDLDTREVIKDRNTGRSGMLVSQEEIDEMLFIYGDIVREPTNHFEEDLFTI